MLETVCVMYAAKNILFFTYTKCAMQLKTVQRLNHADEKTLSYNWKHCWKHNIIHMKTQSYCWKHYATRPKTIILLKIQWHSFESNHVAESTMWYTWKNNRAAQITMTHLKTIILLKHNHTAETAMSYRWKQSLC